jgi:RND family efflux transporter MFP subunit
VRFPFAQHCFTILGVGILFLSAGCGRKEQRTTAELPPVQARTIEIQPQKVPETYDVVGTVRPKMSATVAAKLTAVIQTIAVKPGDTVKIGDPLAQLDDREARAEFERAQSEFDRSKSLLETEATTRAEFDAVEARYRVAKANLSYTSIAAPFDGIVSEKLCDAGDLATPGKPLFRVEQPTDFRLEAYVPERFSTAVQVGTKVRVVVEAVGGDCEGTVGEVIPVTDPATRSFLVKVDLQPSKPLKSGMFGRARIVVGERTGFFVPKSAVKERGQLTFVYVVNEGRAQMRLVKPGKVSGEQVELLSGVQGGEKVIVVPNSDIFDGQRVSL